MKLTRPLHPPWIWFPISVVLLIGGVVALTALSELSGVQMPKDQMESAVVAAPIWLLIVVGSLVPILEALVWSASFVEGFAIAFRRPGLGAMAGVLAYSVAYHASAGLWGILASGWIGVVTNTVYVNVRQLSRWRAFWWVVGLRWAFVTFALLLLRGVN